MKIKTQTSTYELTQAEDGTFVLAKLSLKKGTSSMIQPGETFTGREVRITPNGLYLMQETSHYFGNLIKTSPVRL